MGMRAYPEPTSRPETRMRIDQAYDEWAPTYDSSVNRTRDLDAEITRRLLADVHVARAIEAGCGTGKNTGFFAACAGELIALDFSGEMLSQAREKHAAAHVRFVTHDLSQPWPALATSADLISFNLVLEHIEDLDAVFAHAAAACRPGAVVAMSELHPVRQYRGGQAHFSAANGAQVNVTAYVHHISDYIGAAERAGLHMESLGEWWHADDAGAPPRLLTLRFRRR